MQQRESGEKRLFLPRQKRTSADLKEGLWLPVSDRLSALSSCPNTRYARRVTAADWTTGQSNLRGKRYSNGAIGWLVAALSASAEADQ